MLLVFCRLEDIAVDAELQEKSQADLEHLADLILTTCEQVLKEHEEKLKEQTTAEGGWSLYTWLHI